MSQSNIIEVISPDGGRKEITLQKSIVFIGSDPTIDVPLAAAPGIASRHLQLIAVPDAGCRLVNLGDTEVFLGQASERKLAPHFSTEVADGEFIKIGNFVLVFHNGSRAVSGDSPVEWNASGQSQHIGLSMTLPQTWLAPHRTLQGIVTVANLGDIAGVQFELELEGFEPDCYELEPGPLLSSGAEKEVLFRLYHRGAKPLAGDYQLTIYATAPRAYPAEQSKVSQIIQVQPLYQHKLTIAPPAGAKRTTSPPSPTPPPEPVLPAASELSPPVNSEPVVRPFTPPPSPPVAPEPVQPAPVEPSRPDSFESVEPAGAEPAALPSSPTTDALLPAPPKRSGWWARLFGPRPTPPPVIEPDPEPQPAASAQTSEPLPPADVEMDEEVVEAEPLFTAAEEPAEVVDVQPRLLSDAEPTPRAPEVEITAPEPAPAEELPPLEEAAPAVDIQQPEPAKLPAPPAEMPLPVEAPPPVETQQPEPVKPQAPLLGKPKRVSPPAQSDDWWVSPMEAAPRFKAGEQDPKKNEPAPETGQASPPEQPSKSKQAAPASTWAASPSADDWGAVPAAVEPPKRRVLKFKAAPPPETEAAQPAAPPAKAEDWWTSQDTEDAEDKIED